MKALLGGAVFAAMGACAGAQDLTPLEQLGKSVFFDGNLSANGIQSCAFCHDPDAGFSSPHSHFNEAGVVVEGAVPGRFGNRKPPSAAYASFSPLFHHTWEDDDILFVGGAFHDGRATGHRLGGAVADQAQGPFLNPLEMALPHQACVVARVCVPADPAAYPVGMADVWGAGTCDIPLPSDLLAACAEPDAPVTVGDDETLALVDAAYDRIALALAAYEASAEVNRFASPYDRWLAGGPALSGQEQAGFDLFKGKALCAECHVLGANGPDIFTDFTYDNIGVPANPANPFYAQTAANPDGAAWRDPGLGGFLATDEVYAGVAASQAGKHKVPTLRNLDKRTTADMTKSYMHNGYFKTLEGVVHFYNTRDTLPRCATPMAEAEALASGCWPAPEVAENVNVDELGNLKMTPEEEAALVAFLRTLDDD